MARTITGITVAGLVPPGNVMSATAAISEGDGWIDPDRVTPPQKVAAGWVRGRQ
jgi:hypothetical protein